MTAADPFWFSKRALLAPVHDPLTCTREPCARCRPVTPGRTPRRVDHRVARFVDRSLNPLTPLVPLLRGHAPHAPTDLGTAMLSLADGIRDHGLERWRRLVAWEALTLPHGISLVRDEPADPDEDNPDSAPRPRPVSLTEEQFRAEEARASRYAEDTRVTAAKLSQALATPPDHHQAHGAVFHLRFLLAVAEARRPRQLKSREIQAAQAAIDGWCRSCYRAGVFEPIAMRATGQPYYRDLCRWCGSRKGTSTEPALDMVRAHHRLPARREAS